MASESVSESNAGSCASDPSPGDLTHRTRKGVVPRRCLVSGALSSPSLSFSLPSLSLFLCLSFFVFFVSFSLLFNSNPSTLFHPTHQITPRRRLLPLRYLTASCSSPPASFPFLSSLSLSLARVRVSTNPKERTFSIVQGRRFVLQFRNRNCCNRRIRV